MSSQLPGRQSPEPEFQSGIQQRDPPASGKIGPSSSSARPTAEYAQQKSEEEKQYNLRSNPVHNLEKIEEAKFAKSK